ncbi:hypothetical protein AC578_3819 [Pseudocercospora eumusae]|uniref:Uncharacterized protein n=1 Tax=Pseudocercospora eumusae TaxID=321146 RepID=A0A139HFG0_9PEZI|nr:hypothetical protein AC578_3819 [Pseudocercospora eumusae]
MPPKKSRGRKANAAAPHGYDENGQAIEKYGRNLDGSIRKVAKRTPPTATGAEPGTSTARSEPTQDDEEPQAAMPAVTARPRSGGRDRRTDADAAGGLNDPQVVEKGPRASNVKKTKKTPASVETARRIFFIQRMVVANRSALRGEDIEGLKGVVDILATVIDQLDDLSRNAEMEG